MKKQIMSIMLIVAIMISLIPATSFGAFAAPTPQPIISIGEVWAATGSIVEVNVTVSGNPGIYGATLTISWAEGLELVDAESGDVFNGLSYQEPSRYVSSGTNFIWYGTRLREIKDGTVLKLTFEVAENVEDASVLKINVSGNGLTDANNSALSATFLSGSVRIVNYIPGDTDRNGTLDPRDLVALAKYISDNCTTDPDGFNITINVSAADVNDDGELNPMDLVLIAKYISDGCKTDPDGYNVILKPSTPRCVHNMQAQEAKTPSCTEVGNIAYWYCTICAKYFGDAEATTEIDYANTVIAATGHLNVTATPAKEATYEEHGNIDYWYCNDCEKYFSDESCENVITYNDTVIPAKSKYGITYYLYDNNEYLAEEGVDNPNPAWYDPEKGLALENPAKAGYRFDGWYDAEGASGELVKEIEPGETGDKKLYARWSLVEYTISYKDDVYNVNYADDIYTVDKRKILTLPTQKGLVFVGWEDSKGNIYRELPKGTIGNLELNAKWKSHLYTATPYDDQKVVEPFYYDANQKNYYFVYSLGTLEGIPLENLVEDVNVFKHTGAGSTTLSWSETVTVEESKAESIGKTISTSTSKSDDWSKSVENAKEESSEEHVDVTVGVELGGGPLKAKLEGTYGYSQSTTNSYSETKVTGGSEQEGSEESDESSVTLSYLSQMSTTRGADIDISADSPVGYYTYAKLGNAKVYAIVAFNCETGNYALSTYSILEYAYDTHLYFPTKASLEQSVNNPEVEPLPFDVPIEDIAAYVKANYYVNYDGNGGQYSYTLADETMEDGSPIVIDGMPLSTYVTNTNGMLAKNLYTRTGYTFVGWATSPDGEVVYKDEDEISSTKTDGVDVITLYAVWEKNQYTITYTADKPGHASSNVENMPVNTPCLYDTPAVLGSAPTLTGWIFRGWYLDPECTNICGAPGDAISNLTAEPNGTVPLYGKWEAEKRTITYVSNDGTNRIETRVVDYDSDHTVEGKLFDRSDYAFEGWSIDGNASTESILPGQSYKITQDYTVYAIWENAIGHYYSAPRWEITENGVDAYWETGLNREELIAAGCTELRIDYTIKGKTFETSLSGREKWYIEVKDIFGNPIYSNPKSAFDKHDGDDGEVRSYSMHDVSINAIRDDGTIWVRYDHEGNWRSDWILFYIDVTITAIVP